MKLKNILKEKSSPTKEILLSWSGRKVEHRWLDIQHMASIGQRRKLK